ncbi:MAG: hypothetical protein R3C10_13350 [Pirellulales bacterium]
MGRVWWMLGLLAVLWAGGCRSARREGADGPPYDRPFPLGQVSDSFWEAQQTNAEGSDFVFYDHEFTDDTAELAPAAKDKLMQVALRLEHVPFPVIVEQSPDNRTPELDQQRRRTVVEQLARLGVEGAEARVVVAPALVRGITAIEGERAYYSTLYTGYGGYGGGYSGRRFGGYGGFYR